MHHILTPTPQWHISRPPTTSRNLHKLIRLPPPPLTVIHQPIKTRPTCPSFKLDNVYLSHIWANQTGGRARMLYLRGQIKTWLKIAKLHLLNLFMNIFSKNKNVNWWYYLLQQEEVMQHFLRKIIHRTIIKIEFLDTLELNEFYFILFLREDKYYIMFCSLQRNHFLFFLRKWWEHHQISFEWEPRRNYSFK